MNRSLLILLSSLFLLACNSEKKQAVADTTAVVNNENESFKDLYGTWVGDFIPVEDKSELGDAMVNKISIVIKNITTDNDVEGQSIVAGNSRPLNGKLTKVGNKINFVMDEPGDDQFDGRFEFEFAENKLIGTWNSYKKTIQVTKRKFELAKTSFVYNANIMLPNDDYVDYQDGQKREQTDTIDGKIESYVNDYYRQASDAVYKVNASTTILKEADLKNLRKLDLQILRNTIFARHGYTFKKKTYRQFFNRVDWYVPVSNNIDGQLTPIEKDNIKLLVKFEKYAEDNYDTFGR